jgi:hypothetical protein
MVYKFAKPCRQRFLEVLLAKARCHPIAHSGGEPTASKCCEPFRQRLLEVFLAKALGNPTAHRWIWATRNGAL